MMSCPGAGDSCGGAAVRWNREWGSGGPCAERGSAELVQRGLNMCGRCFIQHVAGHPYARALHHSDDAAAEERAPTLKDVLTEVRLLREEVRHMRLALDPWIVVPGEEGGKGGNGKGGNSGGTSSRPAIQDTDGEGKGSGKGDGKSNEAETPGRGGGERAGDGKGRGKAAQQASNEGAGTSSSSTETGQQWWGRQWGHSDWYS